MSVSTDRIRDIEKAMVIRTTRDVADTLDLRYGVLYEGEGEPSHYVVLLNGRTEWLEKYCYVLQDLGLPRSTALLTWDHRGQGASGGARSYVDDYESFATDAEKIVREVVGDKPYVVVAHSMGGLISLYATLSGRLKPRALVLASPLLGLPDQPVPRKAARPIARLLTRCFLGAVSTGSGNFTFIPFEMNRLTHSVEHYRRIQNAPYKSTGATFGWVWASFRAIDRCFEPEELAKLTVPTLVLGGSEESVVDASAFQAWVQVASAHAKAEVQLRILPGAKHELLAEIPSIYRQAIKIISTWIAPHLT